MSPGGKENTFGQRSLSSLQIARYSPYGVNIKSEALHTPTANPYVREEAGTHRYNVGTDTPKLCATSSGGVPLANSFLVA